MQNTKPPESEAPADGWVGIDHLLSWQEVATILGSPGRRWHVDKARKDGNLPGLRIGLTYRYHPDDVEHLIEQLRAGAVTL